MYHVAVSMPRKSCKLSELEIYIDGHKIETSQVQNDRPIFQTTTGRISLGGYRYSQRGFEDAYPCHGLYIGILDDFTLYARPLEMETGIPSLLNKDSHNIQNIYRPGNHPSQSPSGAKSSLPSHFPSTPPISSPSRFPSRTHSLLPSNYPSGAPVPFPTVFRSSAPVPFPSESPNGVPAPFPSESPSGAPVPFPSESPFEIPSRNSVSSIFSSDAPSVKPEVPRSHEARSLPPSKK